MSRLRALYDRYAARHYRLTQPGCPMPGPAAGHLDQITYSGRGLVLEGWSEADSILVRSGDHEVADGPNLLRRDVEEAIGIRADVGFRLELPEVTDEIEVVLSADGQSWTLRLPAVSPAARRIAHRRTRLRFARDLLRVARHVPKALFAGDLRSRARVKSGLGLDGETARDALETRLFDCAGLPQGPLATPITIILPVYDAFDMLKEALAYVVEHTDLPWHLVLIEDASPDPRVRPYLRAWAEGQGRVTLLENAENLGFIGSVNRGLEVAISRGNHVVLLNSDAFVPAGWASRLLRPVLRHKGIGSVTPVSNDATILNVPVISQRADLEAGEAAAIDAQAKRFNPEALLSVLPTGVGFCMAMNIDFLRQVPRFDPAFGRGYGEEVDWCQKTRALGARHVGLPSLFVEHRGGGSFGSEAKRALISRNNRLVSQRYPGYDAEVQAFIRRDPMVTARLALGLARAGQKGARPVPIYIAHFMGGGAENYVKDRVRGDLMRGAPSVILRVGGPKRWRVELHCEEGVTCGDTDDFGFVKELLEPIGLRRVIYSCAVGDSDPVSLPDLILEIAREGTADRLDVLMHDYFPVSPSYTLLDRDLVYRGPVETSRRDRAHCVVRPNGEVVDLKQWRSAWGRLLLAAERVVVFSDDSAALVLAAYPWLDDRLEKTPHELIHPIGPVATVSDMAEVVGVLGSIGAQKGAAVVARLALRLRSCAHTRLVVIGTVDPSYDLPNETVVTGAYQPGDIERIAAEHGITRWLIPSIWPETFSYTTHEALATGLPVHAFDIGAQGEAVTRAINGVPVPFDPSADLADLVLDTMPQKIRTAA